MREGTLLVFEFEMCIGIAASLTAHGTGPNGFLDRLIKATASK
jgi:hypothetical protein